MHTARTQFRDAGFCAHGGCLPRASNLPYLTSVVFTSANWRRVETAREGAPSHVKVAYRFASEFAGPEGIQSLHCECPTYDRCDHA